MLHFYIIVSRDRIRFITDLSRKANKTVLLLVVKRADNILCGDNTHITMWLRGDRRRHCLRIVEELRPVAASLFNSKHRPKP